MLASGRRGAGATGWRNGTLRTARAFTHTCQGLGALLLAAALAYAVLAWRYYSGEPTIARNYAAEYNETIEAIPEQDRAWDLYIETYVAM